MLGGNARCGLAPWPKTFMKERTSYWFGNVPFRRHTDPQSQAKTSRETWGSLGAPGSSLLADAFVAASVDHKEVAVPGPFEFLAVAQVDGENSVGKYVGVLLA